MNELYHQIDPDGNLTYTSLFTQRNEVYSGSEATVFHLVKLFALQQVLRHNFPIIVDSFRAEDLSTGKEKTVLEISKHVPILFLLDEHVFRLQVAVYNALAMQRQNGVSNLYLSVRFRCFTMPVAGT